MKKDNYQVIQLGLPYRRLRQLLNLIRKSTAVRIYGFGDMRPEQISALSGLKLKEARLARKRAYDEPFLLEDSRKIALVRQKAGACGLKIVKGGRFYHLIGNNDKGKAVRILKRLYQQKFGQVMFIALGDSANDWPMLKEVDLPILVARPDGKHLSLGGARENLIRTLRPGPAGWAEAVNHLLKVF